MGQGRHRTRCSAAGGLAASDVGAVCPRGATGVSMLTGPLAPGRAVSRVRWSPSSRRTRPRVSACALLVGPAVDDLGQRLAPSLGHRLEDGPTPLGQAEQRRPAVVGVGDLDHQSDGHQVAHLPAHRRQVELHRCRPVRRAGSGPGWRAGPAASSRPGPPTSRSVSRSGGTSSRRMARATWVSERSSSAETRQVGWPAVTSSIGVVVGVTVLSCRALIHPCPPAIACNKQLYHHPRGAVARPHSARWSRNVPVDRLTSRSRSSVTVASAYATWRAMRTTSPRRR